MDARKLLLDASVAIDYARCGRVILAIAAKHFASVILLVPILAEVGALNAAQCATLGISVEEPATSQALEAARLAATRPRRLSFRDQLCRVYAREEGCVCVTADRNLERACLADGTSVLRGLALMYELVSAGELSVTAAISVAETISTTNTWLLRATIDEFISKVKTVREGIP